MGIYLKRALNVAALALAAAAVALVAAGLLHDCDRRYVTAERQDGR